MALEQELATYQKKLEEWSDREGKYVLIHESDVIDFFSAYDDALKAGYERFRLKPFLVKQVQAFEQIHFISRLYAPSVIDGGRPEQDIVTDPLRTPRKTDPVALS